MSINLKRVRDEWEASFYTPEQLALLYSEDRDYTPLEVATRTDGPWAEVSAADRVWTLTRPGAMSERLQQHLACDAAGIKADAASVADAGTLARAASESVYQRILDKTIGRLKAGEQ